MNIKNTIGILNKFIKSGDIIYNRARNAKR